MEKKHEYSTYSIISMILGIFAILFMFLGVLGVIAVLLSLTFSISAIVFGIIALVRNRRTKEIGNWMAIVGISLGGFTLLLFLIILVVTLMLGLSGLIDANAFPTP
jgi:hypothetical protein